MTHREQQHVAPRLTLERASLRFGGAADRVVPEPIHGKAMSDKSSG